MYLIVYEISRRWWDNVGDTAQLDRNEHAVAVETSPARFEYPACATKTNVRHTAGPLCYDITPDSYPPFMLSPPSTPFALRAHTGAARHLATCLHVRA